LGHPYIHEVHMTHLESEMLMMGLRAPEPFERLQPDISIAMRSVLIEWLIEVAEEYNLTLQTLFATVNYVDRFLCLAPVARNALQLLGVTCMLIASKVEEIYAPLVDDFVYITDNTYPRAEILKTEMFVLNTLQFKLVVSTVENFLDRFLRVANVDDSTLTFHAHYLAVLSLPLYALNKHLPSQIAAACVVLTLHTYRRQPLPSDLERYCGYNSSILAPIVREIHQAYIIASISTRPNAAREKFRQPKYAAVAEKQPPETLPFA